MAYLRKVSDAKTDTGVGDGWHVSLFALVAKS